MLLILLAHVTQKVFTLTTDMYITLECIIYLSQPILTLLSFGRS